MNRADTTGTLGVLASVLALFAVSFSLHAQVPSDIQVSFLKWAKRSLHPVVSADLGSPTKDLAPIEKMIGDAKIVVVGEFVHAGAEPLIFRNRLFKHLVKRNGFTAIGIESGVVESRLLNDYVTQGKGDFATVLKQGLSQGSDTFRQNGELIQWMRQYNDRLPEGAVKLQVFGMDVPGSPGNPDAAQRPDMPLRVSLDYLHIVDPNAAMQLESRVERFFPLLRDTAGYGTLKQTERDTLTAAIDDLVSLIQRNRPAYVEKTSAEDYEWAERTAIGAHQTDAWFRLMPLPWKLGDGFEWTRYSSQVRDRAMADNVEWILNRLGPHGRILLYAAVGHMTSTPARIDNPRIVETIGAGTYLKARYGSDFVGILNLVKDGEIKYCSAHPRPSMPLKSPPESAAENLFAAVNVPQYVLDLRSAPANVSSWLHQVRDHWNGSSMSHFATADAFDIVYYVSPVTSACIPE